MGKTEDKDTGKKQMVSLFFELSDPVVSVAKIFLHFFNLGGG